MTFNEWLKDYDDRNNPYILYSEQYWDHARKQWMEENAPKRKPLTFEEILAIAEESRKHVYPSIAFARAIESRHGIKP